MESVAGPAELLVEGFTSRVLSAGASQRPRAVFFVRTDTELVCFLFEPGLLFTSHWGDSASEPPGLLSPPPAALVCTEVCTGERSDYGTVWMDLRWEGTQGSSARQTCSAASITPRSPCSSSSMQWEESFQMLSSTRRWGERGRRGGGGFMGDLLDFHHPVVANLCPGWGRSRSCWKPPGPGTSPWWRNCWVGRRGSWGRAPDPSLCPTSWGKKSPIYILMTGKPPLFSGRLEGGFLGDPVLQN